MSRRWANEALKVAFINHPILTLLITLLVAIWGLAFSLVLVNEIIESIRR